MIELIPTNTDEDKLNRATMPKSQTQKTGRTNSHRQYMQPMITRLTPQRQATPPALRVHPFRRFLAAGLNFLPDLRAQFVGLMALAAFLTFAPPAQADPRPVSLTRLHSFGDPFSDAKHPYAVIEGSDGALYGTANGGGSPDYGTVFRVNKDGSGFTMLRIFTGGTDGRYLDAGVTEGSDGDIAVAIVLRPPVKEFSHFFC